MGAFLIIFDFETWMSDKGPDELHVDGCPGCLRGLRCHSGGRFGTILGACVFGAGAEVLRALGSLVGAQDVSEVLGLCRERFPEVAIGGATPEEHWQRSIKLMRGTFGNYVNCTPGSRDRAQSVRANSRAAAALNLHSSLRQRNAFMHMASTSLCVRFQLFADVCRGVIPCRLGAPVPGTHRSRRHMSCTVTISQHQHHA